MEPVTESSAEAPNARPNAESTTVPRVRRPGFAIGLATLVVLGGVSVLWASRHRPVAHLEYSVMSDSEAPWSTAELYLVVSCSDNPDLKLVHPINIGSPPRLSGFIHTGFRPSTGDSIIVEIYDDDGLSDAQEALLNEAVSMGARILMNGGKVYIEANTGLTIPDEALKPVEEFLDRDWVEIFQLKDGSWDLYGSLRLDASMAPSDPASSPEHSLMYQGSEQRLAKLRLYVR